MNNKDYKNICECCIPHIREVGQFIRNELGRVLEEQIEEKDRNSLVSYVDKEAEQKLVTACREILPEAGFITEEGTVEQGTGGALWIIDPLDGTSNFLHGIPHFAISIGLEIAGEIVLGIVLNVVPDECYWAWKDGGAYMNGTPIHVSTTPRLNSALIGTGFPYDIREVKPLMEALEQFVRNGRGVRRMGAAALDLVFVAIGRLDVYYEKSLSIWDVAGGTIIVTEAGGLVSDFSGNPNQLIDNGILVSNPHIHQEALDIISKVYAVEPVS